MKFKKYIVAGTLAVLLSTTAVSTLDGNKADASSHDNYLTQSKYHDKKIAEELRNHYLDNRTYMTWLQVA